MFFCALTFAGCRGRFSTSPEEPSECKCTENMFDRYYFIKVSKKSILGRYNFDVLFLDYFVLIFFYIGARR